MKLQGKRKPYRSASKLTNDDEFVNRMMGYLVRTAEGNAPYFNAGNLLFHGFAENGGVLYWDTIQFCGCRAVPPGLHHATIFPTTTGPVAGAKINRLADQVAELKFFRGGNEIVPVWRKEGRRWSPWRVEDEYDCGGFRIRQRIGIARYDAADVLECHLEFTGDISGIEAGITGRISRDSELACLGGFIRGKIIREFPDFSKIQNDGPWKGKPIPDQAVGTRYAFFCNLLTPAGYSPELDGTGRDSYRWRGELPRELRILFAAGFEEKDVAGAMTRSIASESEFFLAAEAPYRDFFKHDVAAFSCSDKGFERVYAELSVTGFISTYDVPYEPFRHPVTVPAAKTIPDWRTQFYHDSIFASHAFKWLNDPERCKQDLLQMLCVQFIHSAPFLGEPFPDQISSMVLTFNMRPRAAWNAYLRTGDRDFLKTMFRVFLEHDRRRCRPSSPAPEKADTEFPEFSWVFPYRDHDPDRDWLVRGDLGGDDTARADPFIEGDTPKQWYEQPKIPLEPADINLYLLGGRLVLRRMAEELGEKDVVAEMDRVIASHRDAIERLMWVESENRYADISEEDHRIGPVREVQNITVPLFGETVSPERAESIIADLLNPDLFWTPMPCPSCPVNYPGVNGKKGFRPTGYWRGRCWGIALYEAIFGFYRYSHPEHAAYLVHLLIDTMKSSVMPVPENYNPLACTAIGVPFMGFSSELLDPILAFVTGLQMQPGYDLFFDPIALDPAWKEFRFGPWQYRPDVFVSVSWTRNDGYSVKVNKQQWNFEKPARFKLRYENGAYELDGGSVEPIDFQGRPPVEAEMIQRGDGIDVKISNLSKKVTAGTAVLKHLRLDEGIGEHEVREFRVKPEECCTLGYVPFPVSQPDSDWALLSLRIDGYPVTVSKALSLRPSN